jgi:outer membrane protein assembly factor BamB
MKKMVGSAILLGVFAMFLAGCNPADDDDNDNDMSPEVYDYEVPVKATSPWPAYRRTARHSGRSPVAPEASDLQPWLFQTQKGMFHEPILDEDGTLYMGSADTFFYAVNADGTEKWRFATGEMIDSTAILAADGSIFLPAGDGYLYALNPDGTQRWRTPAYGQAGYITWWEGHIAMGRDGTLYAGNDDRNMYAVTQTGDILWTHASLDQVWSCPAVGPDDALYYGDNAFMFRSLDTAGDQRWLTFTLGPVASSPALSDDGETLVVGSFDGYVHAFDPASGKQRWKFPARDHIYASPAIGPDGTIYVGSADGTMYALNPDGSLKWQFDTLDPIRSSASIDGDGNIYFGAGDGRLYCLRDDGTRLWSFATTAGDRNDLNGSPAIGKHGVYIAGEAGAINFVPFGWCENNDDERCNPSPDEDIPADGAFLYYLTNGGTSRADVAPPPAPTEVLTFRLVVRESGDTIRARIAGESLVVGVQPSFAHHVEVSADGAFVSVIPDEPLAMGAAYQVSLEGDYLVGGWRLGNRLFGGEVGGSFAGAFDFNTAAATGHELPVTVDEDQATVLLLRRMAVPQPPMLATFNEIGFDSYNYLFSAVKVDSAAQGLVMLAVEGTPGLTPTVNVDTKSVFPLNGEFEDAFFWLYGEGFVVDVSGVSIAMDSFRVASGITPELTADALNVYAEVTCANIEFFGLALNLLGLCNPESGKMIANGTAMIAPPAGDLGARPDLEVASLTRTDSGGLYGGGWLQAVFAPNDLIADEELPVILVLDADGQAMELGYGASLEKLANGDGGLKAVRLHLAPGFDPAGKTVVTIVNLYPVDERAAP